MIGFIFNDVSLKEHSEIIMVFIRRWERMSKMDEKNSCLPRISSTELEIKLIGYLQDDY